MGNAFARIVELLVGGKRQPKWVNWRVSERLNLEIWGRAQHTGIMMGYVRLGRFGLYWWYLSLNMAG